MNKKIIKFSAILHVSSTKFKVNAPRLIYIRRIAVIIMKRKSAPQDTSSRRSGVERETDCFTFHLLAWFPAKWQHIGTYACWIDCPIDHKVRTRSTGEIFVRMTKYIALRMLDVHGRSIIEWHVIDSPGVRWNEVHRFGCVIRLHVNLYMAYCRKNISRYHADTRFNFYYISFNFFLSLILNYFYYRANTVVFQEKTQFICQ